MKQSGKANVDVGLEFGSKSWYLESRLGNELVVSCMHGNMEGLPPGSRRRAERCDTFTACFSLIKRPSSNSSLLNRGNFSREMSLLQLDDRNSLKVIIGFSNVGKYKRSQELGSNLP